MKRIKYISTAVVLLASVVVFYGCKKTYLDTAPTDSVTDENLYLTTTSSYQVLDGLERLMNTTGASYLPQGGTTRANDWGESTVRFEEDHLGIDMIDNTNAYDWFSVCYNYSGIRQPTYNIAQHPFRLYYKLINSANLLLDNVNPEKTQGPQAEIDHILGQAFAYRAYSYYKLSIYYCKSYQLAKDSGMLDKAASGLPIYLHGTTADTKGVSRSTLNELYKQILTDLDSAEVRLTASGLSGRTIADISMPTFYGIRAKVALVMHDWQNAAKYADMAINNFGGHLMSTTEYKSGFNSNTNPEWMWGSSLSPSQTQQFLISNFFSFVDAAGPGYASTGLITTMAQATYTVMRTYNDVRKETFTAGAAQQTKFHLADPNVWTYDLLYMRLAEMYLTKAEALAELGEEATAITTLETLVNARNPGYDYNSTTSRYTYALGSSDAAYFGRTPLLKEIYLQRRIELFLEGVAYADIQRWNCGLKRPRGTGNFGSNAQVFTIPAGDVRFLFKIPQQEMDANPAMAGQQNP